MHTLIESIPKQKSRQAVAGASAAARLINVALLPNGVSEKKEL